MLIVPTIGFRRGSFHIPHLDRITYYKMLAQGEADVPSNRIVDRAKAFPARRTTMRRASGRVSFQGGAHRPSTARRPNFPLPTRHFPGILDWRAPEGIILRDSTRTLAMRILLVEDDRKVASFIRKGLTEEGYAVDVIHDGENGLAMGLDRLHDIIVLDVMLPQKPGFQVLRELRQAKVTTPVLLLTARDTVEDKVQGLDAGADDYLTKPFAFAELLARVRALLRRAKTAQTPVLRVADLTLDPAARTVKRGEEAIPLTNREFALLEYFLRNPGRVLTRTMIAEHVWDYSFDPGTNVIDVYVNYLRKKIDAGRESRLIHTVRGVGYVLKTE